MIYVLAAIGVVALLVWAGRGGLKALSGGGVRVAGGTLSILALVAAGFLSLRGAWMAGLVLALLAVSGAFASRARPQRRADPPRASGMSAEEARSVLGVGPQATAEEIQAAYTRLMRMAHPDKGGTSGLAAQLNTARDRLLGR
ncbi:MAG TPA: DnaJ domain-containing protein [Caulobacteraceae bacterium]